ncbi:MSC_0882 family membrane protein [Mycoplasmopsis arginini]|uniref:MSC_0882 family membrane protein n=1 Tax=Mycoplasmopsis arginini TaxID=2094 RepID=UPI002734A1F8|nr:hypothetical protein [Mycoplasmopsis arginini]MDP4042676.1 hypothetical protein [Mycoplasmopsis arginini]
MDIKPLITSEGQNVKQIEEKTMVTNNMSDIEIKTKSISSKIRKTLDPEGIIPNGIYKVFRSEKNIKSFNLIIFSLTLIASLTLSLLFAFYPTLFSNFLTEGATKVPWGWYIAPVLFGVISLVLFIMDAIELNGIKKSVEYYREQLSEGITFTPPFVISLYEKLMRKQVRRTWLVVAILFYVGLFTLIFWALKDVEWKVLNFKKWIHDTFSNPDLVVYILCGIMLMVLFLFIIGTIHRKKRMVDIQMFFGNEVMNYTELSKERSAAHKFWAKVFFLSILILLVIPIIILLIVKKIVKRGK